MRILEPAPEGAPPDSQVRLSARQMLGRRAERPARGTTSRRFRGRLSATLQGSRMHLQCFRTRFCNLLLKTCSFFHYSSCQSQDTNGQLPLFRASNAVEASAPGPRVAVPRPAPRAEGLLPGEQVSRRRRCRLRRGPPRRRDPGPWHDYCVSAVDRTPIDRPGLKLRGTFTLLESSARRRRAHRYRPHRRRPSASPTGSPSSRGPVGGGPARILPVTGRFGVRQSSRP